jgi:nucleoside-diphosphate-sugar epimerase
MLDEGVTVSSVDCTSPKNSDHRGVFAGVDLLDAPALTAHIREFAPTHILHLGARTDLDGTTVDDYKANTDGVRNLIRATNQEGLGIERALFTSSRLVCEIGYQPKDEFDVKPSTPYGESKVVGEQLVREATLPYEWAIVRPTSIWGPWFGEPYRNFFDQVLASRYVHPTGVRIEKSFGFVGNAVAAFEKLFAAPTNAVHGKTFYIADTPPIEIFEFANAIRAEAGLTSVREVPVGLLWAVAKLGDWGERLTRRHMPLTSFRLNNLLTPMVYDLASLSDIVGEQPFSDAEGIRLTLNWLRTGGRATPRAREINKTESTKP